MGYRNNLISNDGYTCPNAISKVTLSNVEFKQQNNNQNQGPQQPGPDTSNFQDIEFGEKIITEFTINGVVYTETNENVKVDNNGWQITVPGASKYTITGVANENFKTPRTIVWANVNANKNAQDYDKDMLLEHGTAKIVAIYDEDGNKVEGNIDVDNSGLGWAQVIPGSKVVFEFVPEYGYQLTNVQANGFDLEAQNEINQYTFTMPDTNIHFSATFTKTEDVLKAKSKKVESGEIALGNTLNGGSAQLVVDDVELESNKTAKFEKAAGEYKINTYLNIDLYNVYYKGKNDSNDVWQNKVNELNNEATISLKLEDGINAEDIQIIHNIHNGDKFEVIKVESYDKETNTITFKTKSFSNYAIATKVKETTSTDVATTTPETGDNIVLIEIVFIIAATGLFATRKLNKVKKISKH